jgi:hypothetical protein
MKYNHDLFSLQPNYGVSFTGSSGQVAYTIRGRSWSPCLQLCGKTTWQHRLAQLSPSKHYATNVNLGYISYRASGVGMQSHITKYAHPCPVQVSRSQYAHLSSCRYCINGDDVIYCRQISRSQESQRMQHTTPRAKRRVCYSCA